VEQLGRRGGAEVVRQVEGRPFSGNCFGAEAVGAGGQGRSAGRSGGGPSYLKAGARGRLAGPPPPPSPDPHDNPPHLSTRYSWPVTVWGDSWRHSSRAASLAQPQPWGWGRDEWG
jgi:hypothetical protein